MVKAGVDPRNLAADAPEIGYVSLRLTAQRNGYLGTEVAADFPEEYAEQVWHTVLAIADDIAERYDPGRGPASSAAGGQESSKASAPSATRSRRPSGPASP